MVKSNLFALDLDAALVALAEANLDLACQFGQVMAARTRLPPALGTDDDVARARHAARAATAFRSRCRAARLEDTRPLRAFAARVADFFRDMEAEAAQACEGALLLLTEAAHRRAALCELGARSDAGPAAPDPRPAAPIPTAWSVAAVDRAGIDLEALRPFLTDAALLAAARAHLKAGGPRRLAGASYEEQAVP